MLLVHLFDGLLCHFSATLLAGNLSFQLFYAPLYLNLLVFPFMIDLQTQGLQFLLKGG